MVAEVSSRDLHVDLVSALADELGVSIDTLLTACDQAGAQAVECDWEDDWPTRAPRTRHGWKNADIGARLSLHGEVVHRACQSVGILFVQAGDRRAGSTAFFKAAR